MIDKEKLTVPRVFLPLGGLLASCLMTLIVPTIYSGVPSYESVACGTTHASGCLEWGLIIVGPFYLLGLIVVASLISFIVIAPAALSFALWLGNPISKDRHETDLTDQSGNVTVWSAIKDIFNRNDPHV